MCNCKASGLSVFDMDVEDNAEKIEFSGVEEIAIGKKSEKSFPNVTTIIIGGEIEHISIPNEMFPNVKNVISYNRCFLNSNMLLIENVIFASNSCIVKTLAGRYMPLTENGKSPADKKSSAGQIFRF